MSWLGLMPAHWTDITSLKKGTFSFESVGLVNAWCPAGECKSGISKADILNIPSKQGLERNSLECQRRLDKIVCSAKSTTSKK